MRGKNNARREAVRTSEQVGVARDQAAGARGAGQGDEAAARWVMAPVSRDGPRLSPRGVEEGFRPGGTGTTQRGGRNPARVTATSRPTASSDAMPPAAASAWRQ